MLRCPREAALSQMMTINADNSQHPT